MRQEVMQIIGALLWRNSIEPIFAVVTDRAGRRAPADPVYL